MATVGPTRGVSRIVVPAEDAEAPPAHEGLRERVKHEGLWGLVKDWPQALFALLAIVAIGLFWLVGWWVNKAHDPKPIVLTSGVTIYAVFYVASQAIERILEPFSNLLLSKEDQVNSVKTKTAQAVNAKEMLITAAASNMGPTAIENLRQTGKEAAKARDELDKKVYVRGVLFWVIATALGMIASGWFGLYLVHTIVSQNPPPVGFDILITGLVIGAGTKPLHDLISNLSKSKTDTTGKDTGSQ
jgi:RsiW-degrading membrane proteinase PrsW (M82 family)